MFRQSFDNINMYIGDNVKTITGEELFDIKRGFYEKCREYMGHSKNMTGITELLVVMYMKHFLVNQDMLYSLETTKQVIGYNEKSNELDVAITDKNGLIRYGISIKREIGQAGWKKHEKDSTTCQRLISKYNSKNNIIQDLYRLDNIKRGANGSFPSITLLFEEVPNKFVSIMKEIEKDFESHLYLVLKGNDNALWGEISKGFNK